jgi:hypothetical protein
VGSEVDITVGYGYLLGSSDEWELENLEDGLLERSWWVDGEYEDYFDDCALAQLRRSTGLVDPYSPDHDEDYLKRQREADRKHGLAVITYGWGSIDRYALMHAGSVIEGVGVVRGIGAELDRRVTSLTEMNEALERGLRALDLRPKQERPMWLAVGRYW